MRHCQHFVGGLENEIAARDDQLTFTDNGR
jgi:hypothetical protein